MSQDFQLISDYSPKGDQPLAIQNLVKGLNKGVRHQTLLGATGTGKSLTHDSLVWLYRLRNGNYEPLQSSIGEVVDHMLTQVAHVSHDRDGTEIAHGSFCPETLFVASIDSRTGRSEMKAITAYQRHATPEKMYRVKTTCGREVEVTGDHNFYVLREGRLSLVRTDDLRTTDYIPLERSLESLAVQSDLVSINLLRYLDRDDLFVRSEAYLREMSLATGYHLSSGKAWSVLNNGERMRASSFARLSHYKGGNGLVGSRNSGRDFPIDYSVTSDFLSLVGLYIAEGCDTDSYFCLSVREEALGTQVSGWLERLGLPQSRRCDGDFQVNDKAYTILMRELCGKGAFNKKLPDFWTELSLSQLGVLLSAYFSGDGWVDRREVKCTTGSRELASQLMYALNRFGIWARLKKRFQRATNGKGLGNWFYQITISGRSDLKRFNEKIGFCLLRKQERLGHLLVEFKNENTNVDVCPGAGVFLKNLRLKEGFYQKDIARMAGLSRSSIGLIEQGQRFISRSALVRFLEAWPCGDSEELCALKLLVVPCWASIEFVESYDCSDPYVYDFSIKDNQTFLAGFGGMYVHNTYTIANVIQQVQKPTLVMAHNKTLAAQLCSEFREFFPKNAVHYFVSYYDYYQPEAYNPISDVYIEKDASINDEINKFRHAATANLLTRNDVIIVASVSCIYGLGSPKSYLDLSFEITAGMEIPRDRLLRQLTDLQYTRSQTDFKQGMFHVLGDVVEIFPPGQDTIYRFDFFGDEIESIVEADSFTGEVFHELESIRIFPSKHSVTTRERIESAMDGIRAEMVMRVAEMQKQGRGLEAERLKTRTEYDLEILQETGYCPGIENYTRYLNDLKQGEPSACLLDFFPDDFLLVIDESHITIPQVGAMFNGNFSRKENLVNYGFRLPSAHDNRPLKFEEFEKYMKNTIYVSATPSKYEYAHTKKGDIVQQIIRPTGLIDPEVQIRPTKGQVLDLLEEIKERTGRGERILITTLTKRSAEDLTEFMTEKGVRVRYLHSDIDTMERVEILRDLRLGEFDVLIGINLLREGLDLPEVSLVAILDADKEGFLRSSTALIQTIGRAARNAQGRVIMYADRLTDSMKMAINETDRRREVQVAYNIKHGITPETIIKAVKDLGMHKKDEAKRQVRHYDVKKIPKDEVERLLRSLETEMDLAAQNMEFEKAAELRDEIDRMRDEFGL